MRKQFAFALVVLAIALLPVPGGLLLPLGLMTFAVGGDRGESCEGKPGGGIGRCVSTPSGLATAVEVTLIVLLVLAPVVMAVYLGRELRRARLSTG